MEWVEELIEVGIEDVHRLDLLVPPEDVDAAIARMLPELKPQTAQANLTIQEESDLVPTLMLFGTPSLVSKHRADLQIYTEACKAFSKLNISNLLGHRLYFKLTASHSRGNLNNAEDVRAYIFNVWLCHVFYFIDYYVLTLIICHK